MNINNINLDKVRSKPLKEAIRRIRSNVGANIGGGCHPCVLGPTKVKTGKSADNKQSR